MVSTLTPDITESANQATKVLKSIANEHRLAILCMLNEREMSVGQIVENLDLEPSPVSQHLARLRKDGLVSTRKSSQSVYYSIGDERVKEIIAILYKLFCN